MADSLFGPALTTAAMAAAVSDEAWIRALVTFERELAAAEADLGVIPPAAAAAIASACDSTDLDPAALGAAAVESASPVVPLLAAIREGLPEADHPHLHHGATSQDALDTAAMLVARAGLEVLSQDLVRLASACAALAREHAGHVISGRTLGRQARPTSFGLKAAGWLVAADEARSLLLAYRGRRLAVQLGGAAGSLDVLGVEGLQVACELARRLGLADPILPWHSNRTRIAELGGVLSVVGGVGAKVALDVILLSQDEVGEVQVAGSATGGSSAMPGKCNPARAVEARAAHARLLGAVLPLFSTLAGEHERAAGAWQAEWSSLSDSFRFAAGAVGGASDSLQGLKVDTERMRRNAGGAEVPAAAAELIRRALDEHELSRP